MTKNGSICPNCHQDYLVLSPATLFSKLYPSPLPEVQTDFQTTKGGGYQKMNIGSDVKVVTVSGKYTKYLSRPGREGKLIKIDGDNGLVHFPASKRAFSYYCHDHWSKLKDLREVIHRQPKLRNKRRRN